MGYIYIMDRETIIAKLKAREPEFRRLGVESLSLFGSSARRENTDFSDVDVAVRLNRALMPKGFQYAGRLEVLRERLRETLNCPIDLVSEPVLKPRLQEAIDRDRIIAF
jgi:uncharacterized protein